jgi:hypothetical protein
MLYLSDRENIVTIFYSYSILFGESWFLAYLQVYQTNFFYSAHFPVVVQRLTGLQRGSVDAANSLGFSVVQWEQRG